MKLVALSFTALPWVYSSTSALLCCKIRLILLLSLSLKDHFQAMKAEKRPPGTGPVPQTSA